MFHLSLKSVQTKYDYEPACRRDIAKRRASAEKQKAEALQQVVRQARGELKQVQQGRQQWEAQQAAAAAETARQEQVSP